MYSGNNRIESLETTLYEIRTLKRATSKVIYIGGDFNRKSPSWGSDRLNRRGSMFIEWIEAESLVILNQGNTPTFKKRRDLESVIDITLAIDRLCHSVKDWKVLTGRL